MGGGRSVYLRLTRGEELFVPLGHLFICLLSIFEYLPRANIRLMISPFLFLKTLHG
jgi:hypothetical protein